LPTLSNVSKAAEVRLGSIVSSETVVDRGTLYFKENLRFYCPASVAPLATGTISNATSIEYAEPMVPPSMIARESLIAPTLLSNPITRYSLQQKD
jgi:hypothetical protein